MNETIKTVTEIDPCKAPEGCPELEPWLAYVGVGDDGEYPIGENQPSVFWAVADEWRTYSSHGGICFSTNHYAIDVRTAFAKKHFSEHCRIRNYQEYDPFEEWYAAPHKGPATTKSMCKEAYKLGQQNPTK